MLCCAVLCCPDADGDEAAAGEVKEKKKKKSKKDLDCLFAALDGDDSTANGVEAAEVSKLQLRRGDGGSCTSFLLGFCAQSSSASSSSRHGELSVRVMCSVLSGCFPLPVASGMQ